MKVMIIHSFKTATQMGKPFIQNSFNWETNSRGCGQFRYADDWGGDVYSRLQGGAGGGIDSAWGCRSSLLTLLESITALYTHTFDTQVLGLSMNMAFHMLY